MKLISKAATLIFLIVALVGIAVLLYPAISQYWNSRVQSKAVLEYVETVKNVDEAQFKKQLEEAAQYNQRLAALSHPLSQYNSLEGYNSLLDVAGNGIMGYINIEKIGVELPIYHGVSQEVLNVAAGHIPGTSLPVGGTGTHSALSAHRGLPHAKLFTQLDRLELTDTFTITVSGRVLTYEVDKITVVDPDDTRDLAIEEDGDYCTLVTCTPYGVNTHRLLVRGKRIETKSVKTLYIKSEAYIVDRIIVTPVVAAPILLALTVYVMMKPVKRRYKAEDDEEDTAV